jgi:pyruvate/2-oxoglutarate dehydrogenase complex dihydrolipoamide acyltransferase (E2) component
VEVKLPDLGDGIESGDILEVLVREGEEVRKDQSLFEVETDKATVEVPSPQAGRVTKIHVQAGQAVKSGETLLTLESLSASPSPARQATSPPGQAQAPAASESPPAKTTTTPRSSPRPPAEAPKPKKRRSASVSETVPAALSTEPEEVDEIEESNKKAAPASTRQKVVTSRADSPIPAGPAVRRFAREVGVDLSDIHGSGPGGRITREDILEVVRHVNRTAKENGHAEEDAKLPGKPGHDEFGPVRIESASKIRKTIAAKMAESWSTVTRVTNFDDADVTELEKVRQASKEDYASQGIKLTTMPFVIKAVSMALRKHPLINATYDIEAQQIIYKRYVNIGLAVDSDRGLVVPVLRNTDDLSISELARLIAAIAERVRRNEFGLEDLRGSTFTLSNLGAIGGTYSTPIVNIPEVAILLTGRARKTPVVVNDEIAVRLMLPMSLSYDHRLVDGATAARFLNEVIDYLEAPGRLLLAP